MGYHIVVRKKGMTREDVRQLLKEASWVSVACFLKETRYDDFARLSGDDSKRALLFSNVPLERVPNDWIDFDGEIVFNNMGLSAAATIEATLGFSPPIVATDINEEKRSMGGRIMILRALFDKEVSPEPDAEETDEWMTADELRSRMPAADPPGI
jgi:hypothetical protein